MEMNNLKNVYALSFSYYVDKATVKCHWCSLPPLQPTKIFLNKDKVKKVLLVVATKIITKNF